MANTSGHQLVESPSKHLITSAKTSSDRSTQDRDRYFHLPCHTMTYSTAETGGLYRSPVDPFLRNDGAFSIGYRVGPMTAPGIPAWLAKRAVPGR